MSPDEIESLLAQTRGPRPPERVEDHLRLHAARRLSGSPSITRLQGRLSMAASLLVCAGVLWALFPRSQDAASLVEKLRSDAFDERQEAARKLKDMGKEARAELEKAARDPDPEVAYRAKNILRVIAIREKLTPHLLQTMPGLDESLAVDDRRGWTRTLEAGLSDPRWTASDLDALVPEGLAGAASDVERSSLAARFLERRIKLPESGPGAREALKALDLTQPEGRCLKAWFVGAFGMTEETPELLRFLADPEPDVRQAATWAVGRIGAKAAIPFLIDIIRKPVPPEPDAADVEARMAHWRGSAARTSAIDALGALGAAEATPVLSRLLAEEWTLIEKGTFTHTTRDIAGALGQTGGEEAALAILSPPAERGKKFARHQAIWSLSHLATPGARAELVKLLADPDASIRISAMGALAQHPMREAAGDVALKLEDPVPSVRESAIWTLRDLGAQPFADAVALRLADPDRTVQLRAAEVLAELGRKEGAALLLQEADHLKGGDLIRALEALNGVRETTLYRRVRTTPFKGRADGRPGDVLARVGLQLGLRIEPSTEEEKRWENAGSMSLGWSVPEMTVERILQMYRGPSVSILERDRIRLLSPEDALRFWKSWWAEAQKGAK